MSHQSSENLRKSLHIAFGLGAFGLRWIPWWLAAIVAMAAVLGNWLLLHRIVGNRVSRHERGYDAGIILYPVAVLALILVFRDQLALAGVAWTTLAFGDGFATLIGKPLPIGSLPWNRDKSWGGLIAFLLAGCAAGAALSAWLGAPPLRFVFAAVAVAAIVETLPLRVNDNITVPFAAAVTIAVLAIEPMGSYQLPPRAHIWLAIHTVLAIAGWLLRTVTVSGFISGWVLGAIILLGAGWPLYIALLTFFVLGTLATKIGFKRKASRGLEQERGGRRGFSHAFANVGVAAICAIAVSRATRGDTHIEMIPLFMGIASLATAAADTTATEIGKLIGRRAFLPLTFRRVDVGTEGAISVEGTLAGIVAAAIVAMVGTTMTSLVWPVPYRTRVIVLVTLCAFAGSYLESIAGSWNRRAGSPVPNGVLNFFNTAAGALLLFFAWPIV
jgi:uncharacterized protein (TIGR00297 family)